MSDDSLRPRRSVLYMPAANARALEKAKTIPADALIFDLEDAVAPDSKELAREQACAAAASDEYGQREVTIRCNGLDTPWGADDLAAAAKAGPAAVVLPKVSGATALAEVARRLEAAGAPDHTRIWAMVETPEAIFAARDIAGFERVAVLVMGTNDLAKELRAQLVPGRAPLVPHLATALLAGGHRHRQQFVVAGFRFVPEQLDGLVPVHLRTAGGTSTLMPELISKLRDPVLGEILHNASVAAWNCELPCLPVPAATIGTDAPSCVGGFLRNETTPAGRAGAAPGSC